MEFEAFEAKEEMRSRRKREQVIPAPVTNHPKQEVNMVAHRSSQYNFAELLTIFDYFLVNKTTIQLNNLTPASKIKSILLLKSWISELPLQKENSYGVVLLDISHHL